MVLAEEKNTENDDEKNDKPSMLPIPLLRVPPVVNVGRAKETNIGSKDKNDDGESG